LVVAFAALLFAVAAVLAPMARAELPATEGRAPLIVVVDASATEIDAATLRAAIGYELGAITVAPDDPVAPRAHGTVTVSVDRAAHTLVVSYREHAAPLTRTVDLPRDADAITQEAVLLTGNLARDEAAELLADLTKNRALPASAPPSPEGQLVAPGSRQPDVDARDLERMRVALDPLRPGDRAARTAIVWTIEGIAIAGMGVTLYWEFTQPRAAWTGLMATGTMCCWGFLLADSVLPDPELDKLRDYYEKDRATGRPAGMVLDDVEEAWVAAARVERSRRRFGGWLIMSGAALGLAAGVVEINIATGGGNSAGYFYAFGGAEIATAVFAAGWGAHRVLSEGPVESALHAYAQASGRPVGETGALVVAPRLAFVPGGGVVGFGGSF
jgi:hypothetical protein